MSQGTHSFQLNTRNQNRLQIPTRAQFFQPWMAIVFSYKTSVWTFKQMRCQNQ